MTPPALVIFDCDGVLVDSEMIASRVLAKELTTRGMAISPADCRRSFTGMSIASVIAAVEKELGQTLEPDFEELLLKHDRAAFETELQAVAGIKTALENIPVPVCVASSGSPEKITNSLRVTALADKFGQNLFSASMVVNGKPAPDLFELAAERMHVAPDETVVIEDAQAGVIAAGLAHMRVFGFCGASHAIGDSGYQHKLVEAGADLIFDDMTRLPELLGF